MNKTELEEHRKTCEKLGEMGDTVASIAKSLADLPSKASARRVLIAAGLMAGVYDVDEEWQIVKRGART